MLCIAFSEVGHRFTLAVTFVVENTAGRAVVPCIGLSLLVCPSTANGSQTRRAGRHLVYEEAYGVDHRALRGGPLHSTSLGASYAGL